MIRGPLSLLLMAGLVGWSAGAARAEGEAPPRGPITRLAVAVGEGGVFTVIDEQVRSGSPGAVGATVTTATLGAVGGLLVGAIAQGMSASEDRAKDEEMARRLAPRLEPLSCAGPVRDGLEQALRESGRFARVTLVPTRMGGEAADAGDALLVVEVARCGIRRVGPLEGKSLASFVELRAELYRVADGRLLWEEQGTHLGGERRSLQAYRQDVGLLRRELAETLVEAGRRVAMELLYPEGAE